jgi:hypothetical protein
MFTPEERARLRSELLTRASADGRISGAAITGSSAAEREDRWSDIDLAFGVAESADVPNVLSDWTAHMYARHGAVHQVDMKAGSWIYRVFLLASTLQVDLAFVPAAEFRALAPTFRLVFGTAEEPRPLPSPVPADIIGMSWLYALHARSCIARRKLWQGEYMISAVRDHALTLACLRHGLPAAYGRGFDQLPAAVTASFEHSFARKLDSNELTRAFRVTMAGLLREIQQSEPQLAGKLEETLLRIGELDAEASA